MDDDDDFADFVRTQSSSLFRTAFLLTGDTGRAEELLQETLVSLYPRWGRVRTADSPLAYVRRSVVNAFVSSGRRPANRAVTLAIVPEADRSPDPADRIADRSQLEQLLDGLPARQRAALVLRYFHDLTDAEIAAELGCRVVSVRSLVSRGLRSLRTLPSPVGTLDGPGQRQPLSGGGRHGH